MSKNDASMIPGGTGSFGYAVLGVTAPARAR